MDWEKVNSIYVFLYQNLNFFNLEIIGKLAIIYVFLYQNLNDGSDAYMEHLKKFMYFYIRI